MTVQRDHVGTFIIRVRMKKGASYRALRLRLKESLESHPKMEFVDIESTTVPDPYMFLDPDDPPLGVR